MTHKPKRPVAFLSAVAMVMTMLLYFPGEMFSIDLGIKASAAEITLTEPQKDGNGLYQIGTAAELYWFADKINNDNENYKSINVVLTKDIVVNENLLGSLIYDGDGNVSNGESFTSWTPIGNSSSNKYTGIFEGKGFTVSGLYFNNTNISCVGLFGYVGYGSVSNVGVVDSYFKGQTNVGGVCGLNDNGTITSCYNTGEVSGSGSDVGGVCGYNYAYSGIATITNCYNTGMVSGSSNFVGGVCGNNYTYSGTAEITNCYNAGAVTTTGGTDYVGGVCGFNCSYDCAKAEITNCYFDSDNYSGKAVGNNDGGTVSENVLGKTTDEFNNGEVAYLLQIGQTAVNETIPEVWGQTIGIEKYPVLGGAKVYQVNVYAGCEGNPGDPSTGYSNTDDAVYAAHSYDDNGFCTACGDYEPAALTNNKYDIDGDEKIDEVYEIGNAGQLYWFADKVNTENKTYGSANAVLTANITVNKGENTNDVANCNGIKADDWIVWTPIGNDSNMYTGIFNGINHTVSGLYFNDEDTGAVGLFGCLGNTKDEEGNMTSYAKISSVSVSDSYIKGNSAVGGISGYNYFGFIINCNYKGTVIGNEYTGGICGYNNIGMIIYCFNRGIVSGGEYIGGVCGGNNYVISNCCNRGEVSGEDNVGGVCGGNNTIIANCYNIGTVSTESEEACIGGVSGYNHGTIANCYYNSEVYSGDAVGVNDNTVSENVLGKTTEQFTSGEVAYLLSQGCTIGEGEEASTYDGSVWGQTLTGDNKQDFPVLGGKKVLANNDKTEFANDIIIYGQNAVLDGTIGFNIYVAADDNYEWTAKIDGEEVTKPAKDENGLYKFTCNVAAKDMAKDIEFYINENVKATVSVKAYLEKLKERSESSSQTEETVKLVGLIDAMETYGNAANAFFSNGTVAEVTEVADNACESFEFTKAAEQDVPSGISYYGSSLLLKSETTVRHYFKLEGGQDITNFAFTVKVGDAEYSTVTPVEKQGYYYIDIENISADKLDTLHTVKIGDVEVISNYSAMSYANSVLSSETADDNLKNLVKTLYLYNQKANALSGT